MSLSRKSRWTGVLLSGLLLTTGCYGPFNLTQRLWHWNDHATENRWANEGIFLVCVIVPVYEICTLADAIFFNSWEFWTDKNLIDAPAGDHRLSGKLDDQHDMTLTRVSDTQVKVEVFQKGTLVNTYTVDQGNGVNSVLRDADGVAITAAEQQADGSVELVAAR